MPKVEISDRALLTAFHNRLIKHAMDVWHRTVTVGEELGGKGEFGGYLVNYFKPEPSPIAGYKTDVIMGGMGFAGGDMRPDLYFIANSIDAPGKSKPANTSVPNFVILIEATSWGWVEVRDEEFMPAAEKFARVWEEERKVLMPLLRQELEEKLGHEPNSFFDIMRPNTVTIYKAYGIELTSELPKRKKKGK